MMWGSRLLFEASDESVTDRIIEWLEERDIQHCAFFSFICYGQPGVFTILLPIHNDAEAVYLALLPECIQATRTDICGRSS